MKAVLRSAWAQAVYLLLLVGLVVGFWIWRVRAPDAPPFSLEFWRAVDAWGHRLTGLGWVSPYQTLLAGVLTLAAGAFILLGIRFERAHAAREKVADEVDRVIASARAVQGEATRLALPFSIRNQDRLGEGPSDDTPTMALPLARHYPTFYVAWRLVIDDVRAVLPAVRDVRANPGKTYSFDVEALANRSQALLAVLRYYSDAICAHLQGGGSFKRQKFGSGDLAVYLAENDLSLDRVRFAAEELFDDIPPIVDDNTD